MNSNAYEYESEELDEDSEMRKGKIIKTILFIVLLIIIIIIVLFCMKSCQKGERDKYDGLVKAAKEYFNEDTSLFPESYGDCTIVTLKELLDEDLIEFPEDYEICESDNTYVKVCKLESGKYHYTPVLKCDDIETSFGDCVVGTEDDLEEDVSNVEFGYKGYRLQIGVKKYYPNDVTDISKVTRYYKTAPNSQYNLTDDNGTTGYKWYTTTSTSVVYWSGGAYSGTQPAGYTNKGKSKTEIYYTNSEPTAKSYRTIETGNFTRYQMVAAYYFVCIDPNISGAIITQVFCTERNSNTHKVYDGVVASCDGGKTLVPKDTVCKDFTAWSTDSCTDSSLTGKRCETAKYKYTDTLYQWYSSTGASRSYYPSKSTNASGEITYYLSSPLNGYIRDDNSAATVYRYYKFVELEDGETDANQIEDWIPVTDKFVTKPELIKAFNELEYEVTTLKEIEENEKLKYEVELRYCNRK